MPVVDQIEKLGLVTIIRYDVDKYPLLAKKYGVTSVPCFFLEGRRTQDVKVVLRWVDEMNAKVRAEKYRKS
jgi:hypothetical protein